MCNMLCSHMPICHVHFACGKTRPGSMTVMRMSPTHLTRSFGDPLGSPGSRSGGDSDDAKEVHLARLASQFSGLDTTIQGDQVNIRSRFPSLNVEVRSAPHPRHDRQAYRTSTSGSSGDWNIVEIPQAPLAPRLRSVGVSHGATTL